jgi:hypothetical protein
MKRRLGAKFAMLYLFDEDKDELWTCTASGSGNATRIIKLSIDSNSLAATATRTRESSSTYLTSGLWLLIGKGAIAEELVKADGEPTGRHRSGTDEIRTL